MSNVALVLQTPCATAGRVRISLCIDGVGHIV